ncbi:MAG: DUF1353 domain-containing protein [Planctomycetota bacterium]|nr:DUF1353 domain-containing protein [Planctomycetota bacterium]
MAKKTKPTWFKFAMVMIETVQWSTLKGYKYRVENMVKATVPILGVESFTAYIALHKNGLLQIHKGYAWDGPSGPTWDTMNFMRGSLVHDALYQLIRMGKLDPKWRKTADEILYEVCRMDGMSRWRSWYVLRAVRRAAGFAARPGTQGKLKIYQMPPA